MKTKAQNSVPPANILLTNVCANHCKYCFAAPLNHKNTKPESMSVDNFLKVLDFLERSSLNSIRLLGGEPLIHPKIGDFFDEIAKRKHFDNVTVFTGGLFDQQKLHFLMDERVVVIVNTNHPSDYGADEFKLFISNVEAMADQGINFSLGFNVYEKTFDLSPILKLCTELGIHTLRIGMANPTIAGPTQYIHIEEQKKMGDKLHEIIAECDRRSIRVVFDCVIPLCMFSDEQWGSVVKSFPHVQKGISVCGPSIDIGPDLKVFRCFALSDFSVDLREFSTTTDLWNHFSSEIDTFKWHAVGDVCRQCQYHLSRTCQGGCIAYYWQSIQDLRKKKNDSAALFDEAYNYLNLGQYDSAIERFEQGLSEYSIDADIISDYVYTLLRHSEIEKAEKKLKSYEYLLKMTDVEAESLLRGFICEAKGEHALARQHFRKSMRLVNKDRKKELSARLNALTKDPGFKDEASTLHFRGLDSK